MQICNTIFFKNVSVFFSTTCFTMVTPQSLCCAQSNLRFFLSLSPLIEVPIGYFSDKIMLRNFSVIPDSEVVRRSIRGKNQIFFVTTELIFRVLQNFNHIVALSFYSKKISVRTKC